jgi:hypothetical protein
MFRRGGNVGTGIMTGIVDRGNYQVGGGADAQFFPRTPAATAQTSLPTVGELSEQNIKTLLEAAGPSEAYDPLTSFLLQYGPAAAKQTGGGTFANLIAAAEKPVASLLESKAKESDFLRSLRTQAAGAAIKQRSELETAEKDRLFKKELADMQADLSRELSNAEILAAKERADAKYLQDLELQTKKMQADYENRSKLLKEADLLEQQTTGEKIQAYTPQFAEEYDNDFTKGQRRATFEFETRQKIAENFGESKVGGHIDVDIGDEKQLNKIMKRKLKGGGANKIFYNVNDGKTYLLTEQGLRPVSLTESAEEIEDVVTQDEDTVKTTEQEEKKKIDDRFEFFSEKQKKKIKKLQEENKDIPFGGFGA